MPFRPGPLLSALRRKDFLCFKRGNRFACPAMYELSGTVKAIFDEQTFSSGFNKREFVVTTDAEKYPQDIAFECVKEKVELVDKLTVGDTVKVTFDIRGREWNGRYFVNLSAWRVETGAAASAPRKADEAGGSSSVIDDDPPF